MNLVPEEPIPSRSGSLPPYGDGHSLVLRPSLDAPSGVALARIYTAAGEGLNGLRAVWRLGCDAGMVAPTSASVQPDRSPE